MKCDYFVYSITIHNIVAQDIQHHPSIRYKVGDLPYKYVLHGNVDNPSSNQIFFTNLLLFINDRHILNFA